MQAFLSSPRRRRRLARLGIAFAVVAAAVGIVVWNPGGVDPPREAAPDRSAPVLQAPRSEPYRPLPVTREHRRQLDATVRSFVASAVVRRDLDDAWSLASPEMRSGVSRSAWRRGELPVVPYPAKAIAAVSWELGYVDRDAVLVDVMIQPKAGSGERVQVYSAQLSRDDADERWLVDSWIPAATLGGAEAQTQPRGERPRAVPPLAFDDARLSAWWFLAPAFFVALLVLTPLVLVVRGVRSRRRAEQAYREWTTS